MILWPPLSRCVTLLKFDYFFVFLKKNSIPQASCNGEQYWKNEHGRGWQRQKGEDSLDDAGGKSLSEKSKTARGQCVGEKSTGAAR